MGIKRLQRPKAQLAVLLCIGGILLCSARSHAQRPGPADVSPEVQQLYAQAEAAQTVGDRATAISKYRAMLKLAPHLAAAYNNLGMLYYQQQDFPQAAAILEKGLQINPRMASAAALLGSAYFEMGKYNKARSPLESAVEKNPKDNFARMLLARDLFNIKEFEAAVVQLRTLIAHDPKNQQAWYLLGNVYLQLSEQSLAKVSEIDPNSYLSQEIAGEIMQSLGNTDGALGAFKKAVDLAPTEPGTHQHLANEYWLLGKWTSARKEFQAELANDPNNCQARWKMANSLLGLHGSPQQAVTELNSAIHQCPDLMQARVDRARAFISEGQPAEAVPDLMQAEKASPDEPSIHFLLASAYRAEGRTVDAHNEMQMYGKLKSNDIDEESKRATEDEKIKNDAH
jgi:tetratricopeptide (TPR) repeat protein